MSKKPVHEIRLGTVKAAIWANETESGGTRYNVSIVKLYKDDEDRWQQTMTFGRDDLPLVSRVADLAMLYCYEHPQVERQEAAVA